MFINPFLLFLILLTSCLSKPSDTTSVAENNQSTQIIEMDTVDTNSYSFLFDTLICRGFDFPVGTVDGGGTYTDIKTKKTYSGWYKAVKFCEKYTYGHHPAEDWNGNGGGETDFGQTVYSIGKGIVTIAENVGGNWGNVIVIEHRYYENSKVKKIQSLYAHLDTITVKEGDFVSRRMPIGTIGNNNGMFAAHLHLEIRKECMFDRLTTFWPTQGAEWIKKNYEHPTNFIKSHRKIDIPATDSLIAVAVKHEYTIYLCQYGKEIGCFPIALGQSPIGHKEKQGDNKTPEGEYYINEKSLGPFSGTWAAYFGKAWIRLSYPNAYDAEAAFDKGLISSSEKKAIIKKNKNKGIPPKTTAIGGGIGIHGWFGEWNPKINNDLTWGCISINNDDLINFYNLVPINTRIIILP